MFGLLTDTPEAEVGWGRLSRRRVSFRDVDWVGLTTGVLGLGTAVVNAVGNATRTGTTGGAPMVQQFNCPAGYVMNYQTGMCQQVQPAGGGFDSMDKTALMMLGGGALLLVLLSRK